MEEQHRIRALRLERNLTLQALAERVNTTKSQIDKLEKGERRLTLDWIKRLAAALNVSPVVFLEEAKTYNLQDSTSTAYGYDSILPFPAAEERLPVYGRVDALTGQLKDMNRAVGNTPCPPALKNISGAYAAYVPDDSAAPRYNMGETIFMHPSKPLVKDCYILMLTKSGHACIKQFVGRGENKVIFSDGEAIAINQLETLHRIVGCWE